MTSRASLGAGSYLSVVVTHIVALAQTVVIVGRWIIEEGGVELSGAARPVVVLVRVVKAVCVALPGAATLKVKLQPLLHVAGAAAGAGAGLDGDGGDGGLTGLVTAHVIAVTEAAGAVIVITATLNKEN